MKLILLLPLFLYGCSSIKGEYQNPHIKSNTEKREEAILKGIIPGSHNPQWGDPYYKNFPSKQEGLYN